MIGNMAVRITADRPNFPLGTLFVRAGSAANIALVGVPVRPGVNVTALALRVENVDGATADYAARAIGGVWVVDVPAAHFATVGSVTGGVSVWATGTGADGETSRTWCVGVGDLEVLTADADAPAPAPGQTFWPLRMFDAAPSAPTKYNAYLDGSALKIWNGAAWVEISGGSGTVDNTVTRTSANPVKSSGIWSAIWGALTALPTGFTAIYDWVVAQLAGKYEKPSGGIPASDLAQAVQTALSEISAKADAADLRYRIADAGFKYQFAASAFPITYMDTSTSTPVTITTGDAGDVTWDVQPDGSAYVSYNGFDFAYFNSAGDYGGSQPGIDLQFNGIAAANAGKPLVQTVADRTVNLIAATDETSIDIELPAAVTVDGVRYCRDFLLDVDNSANASDLALEFTALGVDYAFVPLEDDSVSEMMTIGAGERVRLYFTETPYTATGSLPVINVARVTLGDFVTTTQGGN